MKLKIAIVLLILCVGSMYSSIAQLPKTMMPIEVGEQVPDLTFQEVINYEQTSLKLSEFKDKLVILSFWATWCSPCISSMPKMNALQSQFGDRLQIILVTTQNAKTAQNFISQSAALSDLKVSMPSVVNDIAAQRYFPHMFIPHEVWIKNGKVMAITSEGEVNKENIIAVLNDHKVSKIVQKPDREEITNLEISEPFYLDKLRRAFYTNSGVTEKGMRYELKIYKGFIKGLGAESNFRDGRITIINSRPVAMIRDAHAYNYQTGVSTFYQNKVIINSAKAKEQYSPDTKTFADSTWRAENFYSADIILSETYKTSEFDIKRKQIKRVVNAELLNALKSEYVNVFPEFKFKLQPQKMKVWVLKLLDSTKVFSTDKFDRSEFLAGKFGVVAKDQFLWQFIRNMRLKWQFSPPFYDETNYLGKINFKLICKLDDYFGLAREFSKYGLSLTEEERTVDVIEIDDK